MIDTEDPRGRTCQRYCGRCGAPKTDAVDNLLLCPLCDALVLRQATESIQKPPS